MRTRDFLSGVVVLAGLAASIATSNSSECANDNDCRLLCSGFAPPPRSPDLVASSCTIATPPSNDGETLSDRPLCTCQDNFDGSLFQLWQASEAEGGDEQCVAEGIDGTTCLMTASEVSACAPDAGDLASCQAACDELNRRRVLDQRPDEEAALLVSTTCDTSTNQCRCIAERGDVCFEQRAPDTEVPCPEF